jgi:hypothetical protein
LSQRLQGSSAITSIAKPLNLGTDFSLLGKVPCFVLSSVASG